MCSGTTSHSQSQAMTCPLRHWSVTPSSRQFSTVMHLYYRYILGYANLSYCRWHRTQCVLFDLGSLRICHESPSASAHQSSHVASHIASAERDNMQVFTLLPVSKSSCDLLSASQLLFSASCDAQNTNYVSGQRFFKPKTNGAKLK